MKEKFNWEEYQKLVAKIPEERKNFLRQCRHSVSKVQFKLLEGGLKYKKSTLKVCGIIGSFEKPEDQAQLCDQLYKYMTQDPEPTREQIVAEAERIAAQMRESQKEK